MSPTFLGSCRTVLRSRSRDRKQNVSHEKSIFKKIIDREIPADIVYEDDQVLAFKDIAPQADTHLLIIPKKELQNLDALQPDDAALMGHLMLVIQKLARDFGVSGQYRVISNCGEPAGQTVHHLHFHLMAGFKNIALQ